MAVPDETINQQIEKALQRQCITKSQPTKLELIQHAQGRASLILINQPIEPGETKEHYHVKQTYD